MNNENKTYEIFIEIFRFLSMLIVAILIVFIVIAIVDSYNTSKSECRSQCFKQDMTFEEYTSNLLGSSICNCIDSEGVIKTIYSK